MAACYVVTGKNQVRVYTLVTSPAGSHEQLGTVQTRHTMKRPVVDHFRFVVRTQGHAVDVHHDVREVHAERVVMPLAVTHFR